MQTDFIQQRYFFSLWEILIGREVIHVGSELLNGYIVKWMSGISRKQFSTSRAGMAEKNKKLK